MTKSAVERLAERELARQDRNEAENRQMTKDVERWQEERREQERPGPGEGM